VEPKETIEPFLMTRQAIKRSPKVFEISSLGERLGDGDARSIPPEAVAQTVGRSPKIGPVVLVRLNS
jgi:hypothetical protein